MNTFIIEIKRAFLNRKFFLALFIGMAIVLIQFIFSTLREVPYLYLYHKSGEYPITSFQKWIGGDANDLYGSIFFIVVPLLLTIPYAGAFVEDVKSGYLFDMLLKVDRKIYYSSKVAVGFLISGCVVVIPLIFNFLLTAACWPSLLPQMGNSYSVISERSMMCGWYYNDPYLYLITYLIIDFVFCGFLGVFGMYVGMIFNRNWIGYGAPFVLCMILHITWKFMGVVNWSPFNFLFPAQKADVDKRIIMFEILILMIASIRFLVKGIKKNDVFIIGTKKLVFWYRKKT